MRRKIYWTDGRTDRGKTVYPPPPSGSGGIIKRVVKKMLIAYLFGVDCQSNTQVKFINGLYYGDSRHVPIKLVIK